MNGHDLWIEEDFEGENYDEHIYKVVVEWGLDVCRNCGRAEIELGSECPSIRGLLDGAGEEPKHDHITQLGHTKANSDNEGILKPMKSSNNVYAIMDLQYGSTGKGLLAGYLAKNLEPDVVVTAWGPNSGHTYIDSEGRKFVHRMLANGIVSPKIKAVLIGPGSVLDLPLLLDEVRQCKDIMAGVKIIIHPNASVVLPRHLEEERANIVIGSTMKGTGAAMVDRIRRNPSVPNIAKYSIDSGFMMEMESMDVSVECSQRAYALVIDSAKLIQMEGAQGFGLSMYHGPWPHTTSRDVSTAQLMADCAMPMSKNPYIYGTMRTFPIRVANRIDEEGKEVGNSGPPYPDQVEITWDEVGVPPEYTTVTNLKRRVFTFSVQQVKDAARMCDPDAIFLNFANYMDAETLPLLMSRIESAIGRPVDLVGMGATCDDIMAEPSRIAEAFADMEEV